MKFGQGVGSHAAHMLLRAGVGRLRIIDFDQVVIALLLLIRCHSFVGSTYSNQMYTARKTSVRSFFGQQTFGCSRKGCMNCHAKEQELYSKE